jgi:anti-sigma B factor antagonist
LLLVVFRRITSEQGRVVLVGLSAEIKNTMEVTGFLEFFEHYASTDEGIARLKTSEPG